MPRRTSALLVALIAAASIGVPVVARAQSGSYLPGIDVSRWQGTIDWNQVAGDGIRFVFMKATDGTTIVDPTYDTNLAGARSNGIRVGSYHFARPDGSANDAKLEAKWFVDNASITAGSLPPVLDIEVNGGLGAAALTDWAITWLEEVRALTGVRALVYTSPNGWKERFGNTTRVANAGYDLWVAHWTSGDPIVPASNWGGRGWQVWQYTDCGRVAGIGGCVDRDWFNGTNLNALTIRQLNVSVQGTGEGVVTGKDVGIDCGDTCARLLDAGTAVTLTADAPVGSYFAGWGGACKNAEGDCTTTMNANRNVTATFVEDSDPPTAQVVPPKGGEGDTVVTFGEPVRGVDDGSIVVRRKGGAIAQGSISCVATGGGEVDCLEGLVAEARFTPDADLEQGATYTVTVGGNGSIVDRASNALEKAVLTFVVPVPVEIEEVDEDVLATWRLVKSSVAAGGSYVMERAAGATATFTFSGTSVQWLTIVGPTMGVATVTIDGKLMGTFDQAAGTVASKARVFKGLSSGSHTLVVKVLGKRGAGSSDAYVAIDGFKVGTQTIATPDLETRWRSMKSPLASGGKWIVSNAAGATVSYRFTGATIIWTTQVGPDQGKAKIIIDGKVVATVDNYAATRGSIFRTYGGLGGGAHTIRIVVVGTARSGATGTWITIDGFTVR